MTGGQSSLLDEMPVNQEDSAVVVVVGTQQIKKNRPTLKIIHCNEEESSSHNQRLDEIEKASQASLWRA